MVSLNNSINLVVVNEVMLLDLVAYTRNLVGISILVFISNKVLFSLLDIIDMELFDPDLEGERANDFFLRDEVTYIMQTYGYSDAEYDECYANSKNMKYLLKDSSAVIKNNEIKK